MALALQAIAVLAVSLQAVFAQEGTPLPLPADPATACSTSVTKQWSSDYPSCAVAILGGSITYEGTYDPDDECCAGTLKYFGSNSTMGSANCFCDPDVYSRFNNLEFPINIGSYFGVCTLKGYEIPVYEAGTGACSGAPYNLSGLYSTLIYEPEPLAPLKSLHEWLHDLRKDGVILTSFILGIISAIGFGGALFVVAYNLVRSMIPCKYN